MYLPDQSRLSKQHPGVLSNSQTAGGSVLIFAVFFLTLALLLFGLGLINAACWWVHRHPENIIRAGLPLWNESATYGGLSGFLLSSAPVFASTDPSQILTGQLPVLAAAKTGRDFDRVDAAAEQKKGALSPVDELSEQQVAFISEDNLVAIYNTHTGETYALTDGTERLNGKRGGVVKVAATLEQELMVKHGIKVARSDAINDVHYSTSYAQSQETLQALLEDNPSLQMVLDIHRDAGKSRESSLVTVGGKQAAPVLIVVGSDARSPFPNWRQNYDFACELAAEINQQYPGLCLGVRILEGRYNQFLHPRALLLEIGSVNNSTEEAIQTARMLAGPLAKMINRLLQGASSAA